MIFVTIGTQEPFDRLVSAMDKIAANLNIEFIAQVSPRSSCLVRHMKCYSFLSPSEYEEIFNQAELVVAHAGIGTIISALVNQKPLIILPRQLKLKEHRSDHQMATVKHFSALGYVNVAQDIEDLERMVRTFVETKEINICPKLGRYASGGLIESIRNFGR